MKRIGLGVITYNRSDLACRAVQKIRAMTRTECVMLVADDGSSDDTVNALRSMKATVITGRNRGVAWNKNRALFGLFQQSCDVVILLEDDTFPREEGWEQQWIDAAVRYGHCNLAGAWFSDKLEAGRGTASDPFISSVITAQCSVFTREAISYVGFFDPRFKRYGYEHAEHTERLVRGGFGGVLIGDPRNPGFKYYLISGGVHVEAPPTTAQPGDLEENFEIYKSIRTGDLYRSPWKNTEEFHEFKAEQSNIIFP